MKTAAVLAVLLSVVVVRQAIAAPRPVAARAVVWPGSVVTYRDLTRGPGFHVPVAEAVAAWNRLGLGVTLVPVSRASNLKISLVRGPCLGGRRGRGRSAGKAPWGFRSLGSHVVLSSSCQPVVRPLLIAHELGRALGLPINNSRCSLMNSKAVSDGLTYVVPSKCSHKHPPSWLRSLIDPGTAALARVMYTPPSSPGEITLSVDGEGVPTVGWAQPSDPAAVQTVVARTAAVCPTDRDVAAGTAVRVVAAPAVAGSHSAADSNFPQTGGAWCYRAFDLNRFGRTSDSPDAISYVFGGPIAGLNVSASPVAAAPTQFEDVSTATHGSVDHWSWDFGDPASGAANVIDTSNPTLGRSPTHIYSAAGTYEVTLTVTDTGGLSSSFLQQILVGSAA